MWQLCQAVSSDRLVGIPKFMDDTRGWQNPFSHDAPEITMGRVSDQATVFNKVVIFFVCIFFPPNVSSQWCLNIIGINGKWQKTDCLWTQHVWKSREWDVLNHFSAKQKATEHAETLFKESALVHSVEQENDLSTNDPCPIKPGHWVVAASLNGGIPKDIKGAMANWSSMGAMLKPLMIHGQIPMHHFEIFVMALGHCQNCRGYGQGPPSNLERTTQKQIE